MLELKWMPVTCWLLTADLEARAEFSFHTLNLPMLIVGLKLLVGFPMARQRRFGTWDKSSLCSEYRNQGRNSGIRHVIWGAHWDTGTGAGEITGEQGLGWAGAAVGKKKGLDGESGSRSWWWKQGITLSLLCLCRSVSPLLPSLTNW